MNKTEELRIEIIKALSKLTLDTVSILELICGDYNLTFETDQISNQVNIDGKKLGAILNALTKIRINGKQLIEKMPMKISRNNSKYLWNKNVAYKDQVRTVLKQIKQKFQID